MELISQTPTTCDVRDLQDGSVVDQVLLVREREIRRTRTGADYMRLALADRTGIVAAVDGMTSRRPRQPPLPASQFG